MKSIGFITCSILRGLTADDEIIAGALRERGFDVVPVPWDLVEPPTLDSYVVRSPWDYHLRPSAFLDWIDRCALLGAVYNDPPTIRWNAHKRYLFDLQEAGLPIVPTMLCESGKRYDLVRLLAERGWREAIVKPAISASAFMTAIVGDGASLQSDGEIESRRASNGQEHLDKILSTRDALVQPLLREAFTQGERSLVYIDGEYSHAVRKNGLRSGEGWTIPVEADNRERSIAERALATLRELPLFARVDFVRDEHDELFVIELELIDPELYARYSERTPNLFAGAFAARFERERSRAPGS